MIEGIIELDSDFAKGLGFTSDKFEGYLWGYPSEIIFQSLNPDNKDRAIYLSSLMKFGSADYE